MTPDMIPALDQIIVKLLDHSEAIIRKKAVMALHRCYQLRPDTVADYADKFRRCLCDKDPSVMGATLHIMYDLAKVILLPIDASGFFVITHPIESRIRRVDSKTWSPAL